MPIRIPQIVSQQNLGAQPGPRLDPSSAAALSTAPARALGEASEKIGRALADYNKVNDKLTEQDMKLDEESKLSELKDLLAVEDIGLRQEGVEPDNLAPTFRQRGQQRVQELMGQLKYSASGPKFQVEAEKLLTLETIKQRHEGLKLKYARIGVTAGVQNQEDVNGAVFGESPELRDQALGRINQRIGELVATGVWSQEKATSETEQMLAQIEMGRVRVAAQDPEKRPFVIDQLLTGGLRHTKPEAQMNLADSLMRGEEAAQKRRDEKMAKEAEEARKAAVDELDDKADRGELTDAELRLARTDRIAKDDDFRRLSTKVRAAGTFGGRTDNDLYNQVELDILENPHSRGVGEIRRMADEGRLAKTGPRSAATLMKLLDDEKKSAETKDITQKPLFKQGMHEIEESLRGGVGPLESLTREAATRLENAKREYHDVARSGKFDDTQLPEVARKIVDRLRAQTPLMMGDPEAVSKLRYQTPADLLAAQRAGIIPEAEFNRQFKLMGELGLLKPKEDMQTIKKQAKQGAKPGGGR
jgi:F0F1-type ATP synthase epsilon subunit